MKKYYKLLKNCNKEKDMLRDWGIVSAVCILAAVVITHFFKINAYAVLFANLLVTMAGWPLLFRINRMFVNRWLRESPEFKGFVLRFGMQLTFLLMLFSYAVSCVMYFLLVEDGLKTGIPIVSALVIGLIYLSSYFELKMKWGYSFFLGASMAFILNTTKEVVKEEPEFLKNSENLTDGVKVLTEIGIGLGILLVFLAFIFVWMSCNFGKLAVMSKQNATREQLKNALQMASERNNQQND